MIFQTIKSVGSHQTTGLLIGPKKKSQISRIFRDRFAAILGANFTEKQSVKNGQFHGNFLGKIILLEINQFCTDLMSVFNVFLTEIIIGNFNNKALKA